MEQLEKDLLEVIQFFRNEIEYYRNKKQQIKNQLDKSDDLSYIKLKKELKEIQIKLDDLTEAENKLINNI